jgi:hypothetical protein
MNIDRAFLFIRNISFVCALLIMALLTTSVFAHDMQHAQMKGMGNLDELSFLHGMDRRNVLLPMVNCCLLGGNGDCKLYPEKGVQYVNGGYLLQDGEFIPEREATVSPDENFYRCKYDGQISHCFFAPAKGF